MVKKIMGWTLAAVLLGSSVSYAADMDGDGIDDGVTAQDDLLDEEDAHFFEEEPVTPADKSCGTIICIFGETVGQSGGAECDGYIDDYFDIKKYRHGVYSAGRTLRARIRYLDRCQTTLGKANAAAINSTFGTIPDNPF